MGLRCRWVFLCALSLSSACSTPTDAPPSAVNAAERVPVAQSAPAPAPPAAAPAPQEVASDARRDLAPSYEPPSAAESAGKPARALPQAPAYRARKTEAKDSYGDVLGAAEGAGQNGLGRIRTIRGYGRGGVAKVARSSAVAAAAPPLAAPIEESREAYAHVRELSFSEVQSEPLSTFSVDVDTASYSNVRRFLREGRLPPADAVRIEELVNYFDYDYAPPRSNEPFSVFAEVSECPWNKGHRLVHIGIQGQQIDQRETPARNLVFLVDVSGSMESADKLPLLKSGLSMLARNLRKEDRISIVAYAGASGLVLNTTQGNAQSTVLDALDRLAAGGPTNGAEGIELAYQQAQKAFISGGINRVILATDGDFNVGVTSEGELVRLIEEKKKTGVFLTVLGFGTGNLQDSRMEQLADKGNGNYAYIDSEREAEKVLVREASATLVTIAKDVKLQVEWNPTHVQSYRLIGYENRALAARDFNDDKKDAGEIGAGHSVTALYEIVPVGQDVAKAPAVDPLRYQTGHEAVRAPELARELFAVKIRYKRPDQDQSELIRYAVDDHQLALDKTSDAFRWSVAVAGFGMLLRNSPHKGSARLSELRDLARSAVGTDPHGDKRELIEMIREAQKLGLGS